MLFEKLTATAITPTYQTKESAGMDLHADGQYLVRPNTPTLVKTGLKINLPKYHEAQIRSRSGLALKNAISVLNSPGTIDTDYQGEIGVILFNHSKEDFVIDHGDRIAQIVIAQYVQLGYTQDIERGKGGFGSTNK